MKKKSRKPRDELGNKIFFAGLIILLAILAAAVLYLYYDERVEDKVYESILTQTEELRIPLSQLSVEKIRFYRYGMPNGESIKFFLAKNSDNRVRIAFDACNDCYKYHQGYGQSGEDIICIHCKRRVKDMNQKQNGCNPLLLKSTIANGQVVIKVNDLEEGIRYFQ